MLKTPNSTELEKAVLSSIITAPQSIYNCIQLLNEECFHDLNNRAIWQHIIKIHKSGMAIDIVTLCERLNESGVLDKIGGFVGMSQITSEYFTSDVSGTAKLLYEKYMRRKAIEHSQSLIIQAHDQTNDIFDVLNKSKSELFECLNPEVSRMSTLQDIVFNQLQDIEKNQGRYCEVTGLPTGFTNIDKRTGGFGDGWFCVIGGRPSMGKTTFVINLAYNAYRMFNKSCLFFSCEMSSKEISSIIMAIESEKPTKDIKKNNLQDIEINGLFDSFSKKKENVFLIDDTPNASLGHILSGATKAKMKHNIDFVVIDYLQLIKVSNKQSRHLEISEISRELKALARNLQIPVIALAQLSRKVEDRPNKRPMMSDLKESGDIEQDADVIQFIYRPEYYGIKQDELGNSLEGVTEIVTRKNRHGEIGIDYVFMDKKTSTFETYDIQSGQSESVLYYDKSLTTYKDITNEGDKRTGVPF